MRTAAVHYGRKTIFLNTLFFVAGVSFTFFLLGLGFTALGQFFNGHQRLFATIGGIIVILFGLFQLGVFQPKLLNREQRLPLNLGKMAMNPLTALLLGFTFSFSWDALRGARPGQRAAHGLLRRLLGGRLPAHRRVHPWLCHPLPGGGPVHPAPCWSCSGNTGRLLPTR